MQAAGSPSLGRDHNDKSALPVTLIATGTAGMNPRGNLPGDGLDGRQTLRVERRYRAALNDLAEMHATWWGRPLSATAQSWELAWDYERGSAIEEARHALREIADAPWGARLLSREEIRGWLHLLGNPGETLSILSQVPQTLIYGDELTGDPFERPGLYRGQVMSGPAPYDVACFYSSSRWWYGRLPVGRAEMRNWYLEHLNERLGRACLDRYMFDLSFDASLAWRFVARWLPLIVGHHTTFLARASYLRATVIEPASASLRRCS